jgi:hypothetical protein
VARQSENGFDLAALLIRESFVNTETKDPPKEKGLWRNFIATCGVIATVLGVVKGFQDQWEWFQKKQIAHSLETYLAGFSLHDFLAAIITRIGSLSILFFVCMIFAAVAAIIPAVILALVTKKDIGIKRIWIIFTFLIFIYMLYLDNFVRRSHIYAEDPLAPIIGAIVLICLASHSYDVISRKRRTHADSKGKIEPAGLDEQV